MIRLLVLFALLIAAPAAAQDRAAVERQYRTWLETEIRPLAKARGVSDRVFADALGNVTPDWDLPGLVPPGSGRDVP